MVNFYSSTKTLQVQAISNDYYVRRLTDIVENETNFHDQEKDQNSLNGLTPNVENGVLTIETDTISSFKSAHDENRKKI